jgi:excisionase family DNA binding protein
MIERSYSTREVADLFGCNMETVLRLAQKGELKSWRLGRDRRYLESEVRRFMEQREDGRARVVELRHTASR